VTSRATKGIVVLLLLGLLIALIGVGPIFTIWSLNTLFKLEIEMNFTNWCAVVWLMTVLHGIRISLKKRE
jgi:hypothetical protein